MFFIETSVGELEFDIDEKYLQTLPYVVTDDIIKMSSDGWKKLSQLYILEIGKESTISRSVDGKLFITFHLSDGNDGVPEYVIRKR